jgi:prophage DNA circulation protein
MATDCIEPTYLPASYKGVPFNVESSSDEFGRRGDLYEFPLSEETAYQDMGRKARRFRIEGYLIGGQQVALTNAMSRVAESPQPGVLIHPMFGSQLVACVTLTTQAEYRRDKRRTKLSFDFIEAKASMAPFMIGAALSSLMSSGSNAVDVSKQSATWDPTPQSTALATDVSTNLATQVDPATDEASFDAADKLRAGVAFDAPRDSGGLRAVPVVPLSFTGGVVYPTFSAAADPIDAGTATVRRIHADALKRLREYNRYVVNRMEATPSAEALILTTRLSLIRDYALVAAQTTYQTIRDALSDLDFVVAVYDDEESAATQRCDDPLIAAIRAARASASYVILANNIRLPGVVSRSVDGVWPSLVAAQKFYGDGKRYTDVEAYNPQMSPFFIGRDVVAPAA